MAKAQSNQVASATVEVDEQASRKRPFAQLSSGERIGRELLPSVVRIETLKPSSENVRTHSDKNLQSIKRSLTKFGQQHAVVYSSLTGEVLVGNGRLAAMQALGWTVCAAMAFDGTPDEARAYAIADNRTGELADWDWRGLAAQLKDLIDGEVFTGEDLGFDDHDLQPLLNADWRPGVVEDLSAFQNSDDRNDSDDSTRSAGSDHVIAFTPEVYAIVKRAISKFKEVTESQASEQMALASICERYVASID
jgi:hypothetical protein